MKDILTVTGTGDSLFTAEFPAEYSSLMQPVAALIKSCDVRMTNLETNLSDFQHFASAYSGGTWINTPTACFEHLLRFGFNYFGTANNHVMDYSYGGLLSTIDTLDKHQVAHSGTGRSLDEAEAPAILEANGSKVAIFAVDCSFKDASRAGRATHHIPARPGVNYLRHERLYKISPEEMTFLKQLAVKTKINFTRQMSIDTGFLTPDPEGVFVMGEQKYTSDPNAKETACNQKDKERLLGLIRRAKADCDYVFLLIHCHDNDGVKHSNPADYLREFAYASIDAGVSAIFGGGCHELRPREFYRDCPIYYSLGDFIYQGLTVKHLPADFMEKYNTDIFATAPEALLARSRGNKVGLHMHKENYQTILPKLTFRNGKLDDCQEVPVYLTFDRKDEMNGLPQIATGAEKEEIEHIWQTLNSSFKL
ncbi:MAG TPA: CapA family protein [Lentisphaeria bacterium]|nr:CapA family protein [Lentisphaeria bacterium]